MKDGLIRFLRSTPVFAELSEGRCHELLERCVVKRFDSRHVVQASGEAHHHLYIVMTGRLEMVGGSALGGEMTLAVFGPTSTSSWVALFLDQPAERSLVATPDTRLLAIPAGALRRLLAAEPSLYPKVLKLEATRFRAVLNLHQLVLNPERSRRLATLLLMLVEVSGDYSDAPSVLLTHEQLQKMANCSRQVLHTSLKKLQSEGLVEQGYGRIEVVDKVGLDRFAKAAV